MPIPDQLPETHKELTDEMRRERALRSVQTNLAAATKRLDTFLSETAPEDVSKRVHKANTEVTVADGKTYTVEYFSLWTEVADFRLTREGTLLCSDHYDGKYADARNGADKSKVITPDEIAAQYKTAQLQSIANALTKFLHSTSS